MFRTAHFPPVGPKSGSRATPASGPGLITNISETSGNPYFLLSTNMLGLYFQDDWKVSRRLTLNLGVRWDRDFNLVAGSVQQNARTYQELKAIGSPYAGGLPSDDTKDFSPRVGFAYDLTGKNRHVIRGGFGLYYGQIFQNITLFGQPHDFRDGVEPE